MPAFRAFTTIASNGTSQVGGTVTAAVPTGTVAGDYQIIIIGCDGATETLGTPPTGWTLLVTTDDGDTGNLSRIWILESTSATTAFSVTKSGTTPWQCTRVSYSATGGRVGDLLTTKLASGTARATPSVTPPVGDYWVVGGVTNETDATTAMTFTPPTGWTERVDAATTTTPKFSNTVADVAVTGGAATSGSFTMSASDEALSWALVLGPVATIMRRVGKFVF